MAGWPPPLPMTRAHPRGKALIGEAGLWCVRIGERLFGHVLIQRRDRVIGMLTGMIGWLEKTVLDCPDPRALAEFYAEVLGMRINEDSLDWVVIGREPGRRELAFQRASPWVPPRWPDPERPQQLHLDIRVHDVEAAERAVLALGARKLSAEHERGFRVFTDPVGHPFCLVFG